MALAIQTQQHHYASRDQERRQSYRLPCCLVVYCQVLAEGEQAESTPSSFGYPWIEAGVCQPAPDSLGRDRLRGKLWCFSPPDSGPELIAGNNPNNRWKERNRHQGAVLDLSADGLRLQMRAPLCEGQILSLAVFLPLHRFLEILGQVVWVADQNDGPAGVRFINLNAPAREQLVEFIFAQQRQLLRQRHFG